MYLTGTGPQKHLRHPPGGCARKGHKSGREMVTFRPFCRTIRRLSFPRRARRGRKQHLARARPAPRGTRTLSSTSVPTAWPHSQPPRLVRRPRAEPRALPRDRARLQHRGDLRQCTKALDAALSKRVAGAYRCKSRIGENFTCKYPDITVARVFLLTSTKTQKSQRTGGSVGPEGP